MSLMFQKTITTSKHKGYRVNVERYENANEVVTNCRERRITDSSFDDKSKETFGSWEGVKTYDEALEYLKNGYQPTVSKLKESVKATRMGTGKRVGFTNSIQGFMPIVPLALKGIPQAMINVTITPIKCKVIDVYYDMTTNAGTGSETIIKNGQKLLAAIMELEKQGYRFNLYAMQSYSDSQSADVLVVKVKSSNTPIDLKRISYPLTHTSFFRVIGFDWYSKNPHAKYRGGYGCALRYTLNASGEMDEFAEQTFGKNAVLISGRHIQEKDDEYIKEVLTNGESKNKRS